MPLCYYGCGQIAIYQGKNGRWYCNSSHTKCPAIKVKFNSADLHKSFCDKCGKEICNSNLSRHVKICKTNTCLYCGNIIDGNKKFCNHKCAAIFSNEHNQKLKEAKRGPDPTEPKNKCVFCNKPTKNQYFCNQECRKKHKEQQYHKNIGLWLSGEWDGCRNSYDKDSHSYLKRWLIEQNGECCSKCGWAERNPKTKKIPISIHHVDGNYKNNCPENIILLCPNCHSLTETYGSLNSGNGRRYRRTNNKNLETS